MASRSPKCPVCADLLYQAFVAPCGHSVCSECKETLTKTESETKCPECRTVVHKYVPNFAARALIESEFAVEHAERYSRTTSGRIKTILISNPLIKIDKREHSDEYVLFLLETIVESKTPRDARDTIREHTNEPGVCIFVLVPSDCAYWSVQRLRTTTILSPRMTVRVFGVNKNPLSPAYRPSNKRPRDPEPNEPPPVQDRRVEELE